MTEAERNATRAKKIAARKAKKEEMDMLKDLQAVQGASLKDEMKASGKTTTVKEQNYGDTYMKTAVLSGDSIDNEMSEDAAGERKMKIGKGANAADKPDDAVGEKGARKAGSANNGTASGSGNANKPASGSNTAASGSNTAASGAANTRSLQGSNATKVSGSGNATKNATAWKGLKSEGEKVRVVVNKKMFEKGGPLHGIKHPIVLFNTHGPDQVKDYPVGKKSSYNANGTRINKTKAEQEAEAKKKAEKRAAAGNGTFEDEDDDELTDTVANQVMEVEFMDADTMEEIPIRNLKPGMLRICMM